MFKLKKIISLVNLELFYSNQINPISLRNKTICSTSTKEKDQNDPAEIEGRGRVSFFF